MKLIDILVQELPKLGGWPDGIDNIEMLSDGTIYFNGDIAPDNYKLTQCSDGWSRLKSAKDYSNAVTREQYEAALAASKPEWDGEGIPPVGCCVEANYGGVWVKATVAYTEPPEKYSAVDTWKEALVFDCNTTRPFWADEFRPIRSEADKKKEEAVFAIAELCRQSATNGHSAELIYDAIKSGKIVID